MAITTIVVYNLNQQLTESELAQAQALWKEKGPSDYEIQYAKIIGKADRSDRIFVRVRDGRVDYATLNGTMLPKDKAKYYSVDGMFSDLGEFLRKSGKDGNATSFIRAIFDISDGHPKWYVRRVMWSRERVEIRVQKFEELKEKK